MHKYRGAVFAAGGVLVLLGLTTVAGSLGNSGDNSFRALGGVLVSFGCILVAAMFYLDARHLQARREILEAPAQHPRERCFVCGAAKARMRCTEHQVRLCFACIESHHREPCHYVPLRPARASRESGDAMAAVPPEAVVRS